MSDIELCAVPSHLWRVMRDGKSLGWVAVSRNPSGALEIGWGTREPYRRQGICTAATLRVLAWLSAEYPGEEVIALIRPANVASLGVARKAGMRELSRNDERVVMVFGQPSHPRPEPEHGAGMSVVSYESVAAGSEPVK